MRPRALVLAIVLASCSELPLESPAQIETSVPTSDATAATTRSSSSTTTSPTPMPPDTDSPPTSAPAPSTPPPTLPPESLVVESFPVPSGSRPHDVAPATDGGVWYTAQGSGELGWLDPETGATRHVSLGAGSRPHGVIVDDTGTPWITDGGMNAIVRVDPDSFDVTVFPLPDAYPGANLNTGTFDDDRLLWFTGQEGVYGALDPDTGEITMYEAPGGRGPYGITTAPDGTVFYASLAGSFVGRIEPDGSTEVLDPPTPDQGARRVWADSRGRIWVSEWNSGNLSRYSPDTDSWDTWSLPGDDPATYAVYVDDLDVVWMSDFGSNSLIRFDPVTERFSTYSLPHQPGQVRQILGRPGEVWGAESAADHLVRIRTR